MWGSCPHETVIILPKETTPLLCLLGLLAWLDWLPCVLVCLACLLACLVWTICRTGRSGPWGSDRGEMEEGEEKEKEEKKLVDLRLKSNNVILNVGNCVKHVRTEGPIFRSRGEYVNT